MLIFSTDPASGASDDWYKGSMGVRFAYTMELGNTFTISENEIIPIGKENWAGNKVMFRKMIDLTK